VLKIASNIPAELGSPVAEIRFWLSRDFASPIVMLMPEATMYQNDFAAGSENEVRLARKVLVVKPEAVAKLMDQAAHRKLWLHPLASDAPHILTAFLRR
jgi:hypothetical protein